MATLFDVSLNYDFYQVRFLPNGTKVKISTNDDEVEGTIIAVHLKGRTEIAYSVAYWKYEQRFVEEMSPFEFTAQGDDTVIVYLHAPQYAVPQNAPGCCSCSPPGV